MVAWTAHPTHATPPMPDELLRFFTPAVLLSALIALVGLAFLPAVRSGVSLVTSYYSRILLGFWQYARGDFRDIINVTLNIIYRDEAGVLRFDIDTIVCDRHLNAVFISAALAFKTRTAAARARIDNPILPLYARRRRSRLKRAWRRLLYRTFRRWPGLERRLDRVWPAVHVPPKRLRGRLFCRLKPHIRYRKYLRNRAYKEVNRKLVSLAGEHLTNKGAADHAIGIPHRVFRIVVCPTYEVGIPEHDQHNRVMLTWEDALLNLPEECPATTDPHMRLRYRTLQVLARQYRRHPWKFDILYHRVPLRDLADHTPFFAAQPRAGDNR